MLVPNLRMPCRLNRPLEQRPPWLQLVLARRLPAAPLGEVLVARPAASAEAAMHPDYPTTLEFPVIAAAARLHCTLATLPAR